MNSVHEPGSRTMSKNRLRNSIESYRAKNRLSASSAQPIGPVARPGRAPRAYLPRASTCAQRPCLRPLGHSTNLGSSPPRSASFFFSLFFFISFSHWKIPKKYIYLFSFIFQYTNKFIKIYFIYIIFFSFSIFHTQINS